MSFTKKKLKLNKLIPLPKSSPNKKMMNQMKSAVRYLVVGEGIVAPLMALCLREQGLQTDLLHRKNEIQSRDNGSIVLPPSVTHFLTEDLGLSGAQPPGNIVSSYYSYDNRKNVLMNLNLEGLKHDETGSFFCCQRSEIEKLLVRECQRGAQYLEHANPVSVLNSDIIRLDPSLQGVKTTFVNGNSRSYTHIINCSRNMGAVPLMSTSKDDTCVDLRKNIETTVSRADESSPLYLDWTVPLPSENWELQQDEIAEIVHRQARKMYVRPVSATQMCITLTAPKHGTLLNNAKPANHFNALLSSWSVGEEVTHNLWKTAILPALTEAVPKSYKKVEYLTPTYCLDDWTELPNNRIIRIGPAAHSTTSQAIDVGDAIDFQDCFGLSEFLASHNIEDINGYLKDRREEVIDEMNQVAALDEITLRRRKKMAYSIRRTYQIWTKAYSRAWKRSLRPFC